MNEETKVAVTKALDSAIVKAAHESLEELVAQLDEQQIANNILRALSALRDLQRGIMPEYDPWVALLYAIWYQPGHINLAYTLTRLIPKDNNPLHNGSGDLQVFDFGCGELAMQFGLALAAADAYHTYHRTPKISVVSEDDSEPMKKIGRDIWHNFLGQVSTYPELASLLEICQAMKPSSEHDPKAICWLTALHVAYEENAETVKQQLDFQVSRWKPELVLVTAHEVSEAWAYNPASYGYSDISQVFSGAQFVLDGEFEEVTKFRTDLCDKFIDDMLDFLGAEDYWFARNYLTRLPTGWVTTKKFETRDFLYRRD